MTREELTEKLAFVVDEQVQKHTAVYVSSPQGGVQLFNIIEDNLPELQKMFIETISRKIFDDEEFTIEDYSTSLSRGNVYYRYDLQDDNRPQEMTNMETVLNELNPDRFDTSQTPIEAINGIYIVIRGHEDWQNVVLYKYVLPVDKIYSNSNFLMVLTDHDQFQRMDKNMLRISPTIQMLWIDGEIILLDLKKLERNLKLDDMLRRETEHDIASINERNILASVDFLQAACCKSSMCKKLRHAMTRSKVITNEITNEQLITFARSKDKLQFHFSEDDSKFDLKSKAEAERFIKLMDDDFLKSELTHEDYDSIDKDVY